MANSYGLLQISSLCLDVELLKFGERYRGYSQCQYRAKPFIGERVETRREGRKAR
jgi:hypothetical protein